MPPEIRLFNEDRLAAMKRMKDKQFQLALVDPPYGIGNWTMEARIAKPYNRKWKVDWNDAPPAKAYFDELFRVSKNQIVWGVNYYREYVASGGAIVWNKGNTTGIGSACEIASNSLRKQVDYLFLHHAGFITKDKDRIHPCQKPVRLYEWLLKNYAKPGDRILDTHGGSFSSAIAAYILDFDYTGYEIDKDYFEAGKKRVEDFMKQGRLFT
uniref:Putative methyltransferase n=1 Tax=viral metagenome TaxID=1070528 RepID=A0A6H1Z6P6_9ZZZZ